jgi:hypothetical protein
MTANVEHSDSQSHSWMIRTAENILSGPFTKHQVIQLIQEGKLDLTDEVCGSGHYWVFLHEEAEIKAQLGVDLPQSFFDAEESTQTESDNTPAAHLVRAAQNNPTGPIAAMGTRGARSPTLSDPSADPSVDDDDDNVPELSVPADSIEEQASVLSNRAYREFRPHGPSGATRVLSMENALKESGFETANQPEPQFSGSERSAERSEGSESDSYSFKDEEVTPPPIDMPRSPSSGPVHNTSLSLDPEPADWTARFWGVVAFILIAAAAVVWFFAFRKPV